MDFGSVFIALTVFTIAALVFPLYLTGSAQKNVEMLRDTVERDYPVNELASRCSESVAEQGRTLWDFLVDKELEYRIGFIKIEHHVPIVTAALVIEVLVFGYAAHRVSRGPRGVNLGFMEDWAVGLSYLLIAMSIYITYRAFVSNMRFNGYMTKYNDYVALWQQNAGGDDGRQGRMAS